MIEFLSNSFKKICFEDLSEDAKIICQLEDRIIELSIFFIRDMRGKVLKLNDFEYKIILPEILNKIKDPHFNIRKEFKAVFDGQKYASCRSSNEYLCYAHPLIKYIISFINIDTRSFAPSRIHLKYKSSYAFTGLMLEYRIFFNFQHYRTYKNVWLKVD